MPTLMNKLLQAMEAIGDSHLFDLLSEVYTRQVELENGLVKMDSAFRTNPVTGDGAAYAILQALLHNVPLQQLDEKTEVEMTPIKEYHWFECQTMGCDPTPIRVSTLDYLNSGQKWNCPHCNKLCIEIQEPGFIAC